MIRMSGWTNSLTGKLTLCLIGAGMAYYIKTTAREQPDRLEHFPELTRFEAAVESVLADQAREDLEPGAHLTGGITFAVGRDAEEVLRGWQAVVEGLRGKA